MTDNASCGYLDTSTHHEIGQTQKRIGSPEVTALDRKDHDRYTTRAMIIDGLHRCSWLISPSGSSHSRPVEFLLSSRSKLSRLAGQPTCIPRCRSPQLVRYRRVSSRMGTDEPFIDWMRQMCGPAGRRVPATSPQDGSSPARLRARLGVCYKPASSISVTSPSADKAATIRWQCSWLPAHSEETLGRRRAALIWHVPGGSPTGFAENPIAHVRILRYARFTAYRLRDGGSWSFSDSSHADQAKSWPTPTPSAIQLGSRSTDA